MAIYQKLHGVATIEIEGVAKKQRCDDVTIEVWDPEYDDVVRKLKAEGKL